MTKEEIIEGNKLIAEFLGWSLKSYPSHIKSPFHGRSVWWSEPSSDGKTRGFAGYEGEELFYDSWEMLMLVVEKISCIRFPGEEHTWETPYPRTFGMLSEEKETVFMVRFNRYSVHTSKSLIEATWMGVIEFIKSYNTWEKS